MWKIDNFVGSSHIIARATQLANIEVSTPFNLFLEARGMENEWIFLSFVLLSNAATCQWIEKVPAEHSGPTIIMSNVTDFSPSPKFFGSSVVSFTATAIVRWTWHHLHFQLRLPLLPCPPLPPLLRFLSFSLYRWAQSLFSSSALFW